MGKKRKKAFGSDEERIAHEARVEAHLGAAYARVDAYFASRGQERPADSAAYVYERIARERGR